MAVTSKPSTVIDNIAAQTGSIPRAAGNQWIDPAVKSVKLGGQAKRKVDDAEDELQNSHGDANMVSADGAVELAGIQDGPMLLAQAETGAAGGGAGAAGAAGAGAAGAGAGAAGAEAVAAGAGITAGMGGAIALGVGAVAAAVGGGAAAAVVSTIITGTIMAGPLIAGHGLTIEIFAADGTTWLGTGDITADGVYSVNIGSYTGAILAKILDSETGSDYMDEGTGVGKDLSVTLTPPWVSPRMVPSRSTSTHSPPWGQCKQV